MSNDHTSANKRPRPDPVDVRIAAIDTKLSLDVNQAVSISTIRVLIQECAQNVANIVKNQAGVGDYDMGRLIHAMDLFQQAKDTAIMAIILPVVSETLEKPSENDNNNNE